MKSWFSPLSRQIFKYEDGSPHWLASEGWFPKDNVVGCTKKGSKEIDLKPLVMEHVDNFVRTILPREVSYCLTIDGHKSRNGVAWLLSAKHQNFEIVQSPANTTHRLQPCDQLANKRIKEGIRVTRCDLDSMAHLPLCSMPYKLMPGVAGYQAVGSSDIRRSFEATGLWPMDYRFVQSAKDKEEEEKENLVSHGNNASTASPGSRLVGVRRRQTDSDVYRNIIEIVGNTKSPSEGISKIKAILQHHKSVHDILSATKRSLSEMVTVKTATEKRVVLLAGAPAAHLTITELIKQLEERDKNAKEEVEAKARRRREKETMKKVQQRNKAFKKPVNKKKRKTGVSSGSKTVSNSDKVAGKEDGGSSGDARVSCEAVAVEHHSQDEAAAVLIVLSAEVPKSAPF